jgi:5,10-methylenetetrahydromethanopterin reductase
VTGRLPDFGVALPTREPVAALVQAARDAEALGYRQVWVTDDRLQRDVFTILASLACATETVRLGPGVTNPFSRHPALIATAIATLDELSGGRAVLGLGAGGTNHRALGIRREAPVKALAEAIELVRGLLAGREVTIEGRVVRSDRARLDFEPLRPSVPIHLGARGPKMLELAGAVADGAIVGNVAAVDGWRYALARIAAGAGRAGRDLASVELMAWVYCSIDDDPAAALDAIRPQVATSLATSRPILADLGLELPPGYERRMDELGWSLEEGAVRDAGMAIPEETLRFFGLAGTPRDCADALEELLDAFPGIGQVAIVPAPSRGATAGDVVRRFAAEVVPHLVSRPAGVAPAPAA